MGITINQRFFYNTLGRNLPSPNLESGNMKSLQELLPEGIEVKKVATGAIWSEGPCWVPEHAALRWSDIPNNRILQYFPESNSMEVYQANVEFTNGRTLDLDGSIIQCSHGNRRLERDRNGTVSSLVESYDGVRLNSPNDVVVSSDGTIWFTDPPYGIWVEVEGHPGVKEYEDCFVFALEPKTNKLRVVVTDVEEPNGLAFSPDETLLYVADTSLLFKENGNHHIRVYDIQNGRAKNGRTFAVIDEGVADGFRVDVEGNVWTSSTVGIHIIAPTGERIGLIPVPEKVGNLCFGGKDGSDLYIAATTSLYHIRTSTRDAAQHY